MCRYAWHDYRDHFACFDCRKAFKHWQWEEVDERTFKQRQKLRHPRASRNCLPGMLVSDGRYGVGFQGPSAK